ncbi:zf-TFIIB domain-containing protein [Oscillatoriales cyanobacterium LEGE 11467]|uniref:Zf-TFIIB domain-containing protein n=1 Tax=Zarconia navalis LEGE 11467 TaxID=1828826 RepID=A0A928VTW3_9CYAN|nr:zf-TFIIB domain-containing protein [Zarconia navalis]MBE9039314.1 zf-TFIIB domain-containing protein [Zarconia navalis LEGE 11467]
MRCPKDNNSTLIDRTLDGGLAVQYCPSTEGQWIRDQEYRAWLENQNAEPDATLVAQRLTSLEFDPAAEDLKAALCPECGHYLTRAKVMTRKSFFVERCGKCGGIWCDRGEWEALQMLGLHTRLDELFSGEWQTLVRERQQSDRQREATIDKLGSDLAGRIFDLAEALKAHPNGDFGVAYLMQQFNKAE